jgi:hypothetical protein
MGSLLGYFLRILRRDYVFLGLFMSLGAVIGVSRLLGGLSIDEVEQMRIVYSLGGIRLVMWAGTVVMIAFFVRNLYQTKEVDILLSLPISRAKFVLGLYLSFAIVACLLVFLALSAVYAVYFHKVDLPGLTLYGLGLAGELLILIAISLLFALFISSTFIVVFLSGGAYFVSKSFGYFVSLIEIKAFNVQNFTANGIDTAGDLLVFALSSFFPRLDLFSYSKWAIYGVSDWLILDVIAVQTLIYTVFILSVAIFDFKKRSVR